METRGIGSYALLQHASPPKASAGMGVLRVVSTAMVAEMLRGCCLRYAGRRPERRMVGWRLPFARSGAEADKNFRRDGSLLDTRSADIGARGLWPMMRRVAVAGATRALRCRDWHE
eukprot:7307861-Prymnesium_polylepis.1